MSMRRLLIVALALFVSTREYQGFELPASLR
jgi:hypothetical protein